MFTERTSVGLDVHARSVVAAAIDGVTGEFIQTRLTPSHEHIRSWLIDLPGPVAVVYEAGPTGFGLARTLTAAGIGCEVVAPSKLQRPSGDRVKTDTKDARGDLMGARHRLSKLLLRQGIVYSGGQAWTGVHDAWLRAQRFDSPALQMTYESDYDAVLTVKARRDRLDNAIAVMAANSDFTPVVRRLSCLRGVSNLTALALALAVEIGDWHRFTGNTIGAFVGLVPSEYSSGQSRSRGSGRGLPRHLSRRGSRLAQYFFSLRSTSASMRRGPYPVQLCCQRSLHRNHALVDCAPVLVQAFAGYDHLGSVVPRSIRMLADA